MGAEVVVVGGAVVVSGRVVVGVVVYVGFGVGFGPLPEDVIANPTTIIKKTRTIHLAEDPFFSTSLTTSFTTTSFLPSGTGT